MIPAAALLSPPVLGNSVGVGVLMCVTGGDEGVCVDGVGVGVLLVGVSDGVSEGVGVGVSLGSSDGVSEGSGDGDSWHSTKKIFPAL